MPARSGVGKRPVGKRVLCGQSETADFLSSHFLSILRLPDSAREVWEAGPEQGSRPMGGTHGVLAAPVERS